MNRFVGLRIDLYDLDRLRNFQFVGIENRASAEYIRHTTATANKGTYRADVIDCNAAVNTNEFGARWSNAEQEYPLLEFRDIIYLPLTWDIVTKSLGWQFSFDTGNGLAIDSTRRMRPIVNRNSFRSGIAAGFYTTHYIIGESAYVGYPGNTMSDNYNFYVMFYGQDEVIFNLQQQLSDGIYSMDMMVDTNGVGNPDHDMKPTIVGNVFTILCEKRGDKVLENVLIKLDMTTGEIISREFVPRKQV
jgi:hypothetical protein